jgi:hypothetical protein
MVASSPADHAPTISAEVNRAKPYDEETVPRIGGEEWQLCFLVPRSRH